jgi:hypothetical protein
MGLLVLSSHPTLLEARLLRSDVRLTRPLHDSEAELAQRSWGLTAPALFHRSTAVVVYRGRALDKAYQNNPTPTKRKL